MKRIGDPIYHTQRWRKLRRAYYRSEYGVCEWCGGPGKIVDHIEPITNDNLNDPQVTFGWDNLQLLCQECHNTKTFKKYNSIREDVTFDELGNLVKRQTNELLPP
jgi:5-methylcytosine-specific restriction endonuclease McrA